MRSTAPEASSPRSRAPSKQRPQTVAEKLGRPDSGRRSTLLPQLPGKPVPVPKQEEENEPMVLVTMELAQPLYAKAPYRLNKQFVRPRPAPSSSSSMWDMSSE